MRSRWQQVHFVKSDAEVAYFVLKVDNAHKRVAYLALMKVTRVR